MVRILGTKRSGHLVNKWCGYWLVNTSKALEIEKIQSRWCDELRNARFLVWPAARGQGPCQEAVVIEVEYSLAIASKLISKLKVLVFSNASQTSH